MKLIKELFTKYKEIIMYLIMGGATTVVNWVVYGWSVKALNFGSSLSDSLADTFGVNFTPDTIDIFIANVLAWILSVIFAYITNKLFVFESYSWKPKFVLRELALFVSARLATGVLEIFGVPFLVSLGLSQTIFGFEGMLSKVVVSVLVVILNYVFSKLFIFKKEESR